MADPQLRQMIKLQITGTQQIVSSIQGVEKSFDKYAKALQRTTKSQKKNKNSMRKLSDQGIANMQAGLVQLSTYLLNMNVKINNVFENMTKRFTDAEDAMTQLRITMGLTNLEARTASEKDGLSSLVTSYDKFEGVIDRVAATTEYSKKEVANAFTSLIQSGRSAEEAMSMLRPVLQLTTASAGQLGLAEAVDIATLTIGTLGGKVEDVRGNLNMLLRTTQKTKIGFKDLQHTLGSLRAGFSKFAKPTKQSGETRESQLMALASIVRETGLGHAEAGQKVDQFSKSLSGLGSALMKNELRTFLGKGGKGRFSQKRSALLLMFGIDPNADFRKPMKELFKKNSITKDEALDLMLQSKLGKVKDGKVQRLDLGQTLDTLTREYAKLVAGKGKKKADDFIKAAMGQDAAVFVLNAIAQKSTKVLKNVNQEGAKVFYTAAEAGQAFRSVSKELAKDVKDLENAEKEAMKTLSYKMKVLTGAQDALSNSIFKHDAYAQAGVETYKEMIVASTTLMNNNEGLATSLGFMGRMMQLLTGFGTNMGFMLVASATFSMGLKHAQDLTGRSTKSLGGTMRAFHTAFLSPTLLVVRQLAGGFFLLGLLVVSTMRYISGAQVGIGKGFSDVLNTVTQSAKALGGFINLAFHKDYQNKSVRSLRDDFVTLTKKSQGLRVELETAAPNSERYKDLETRLKAVNSELGPLQKALGASGEKGLRALGDSSIAKSLAGLVDVLRSLGNALYIVFESAIKPVMAGIESIFFVLGQAFKGIFFVFKMFAEFLGYTTTETGFLSESLKVLGYFIGTVFTGFMMFKSLKILVGVLGGLKNMFVSAGTGIGKWNNNVKRSTSYLNTNKSELHANATALEKLNLKYTAATGQTKKLGDQVAILNERSTNSKSKLATMAGNLGKVAGKAAAFGGGLASIGMLVSMAGPEYESMGNGIMQVGMALSLLIGLWPAIAGFFALLKSTSIVTGLTMLAAFWPVYLAIAAIAAIGAGLYYAFSDDEETPKTEGGSVSTAGIANAVAPMAGAAASTTSMPSPAMSSFSGKSNTPLSPSTSPMVNTSSQGFSGPSDFVGPPHTKQQTINITQKINISESDNPREVAKLVVKKTRDAVQSADSFAYD